MVKSTSCGKMFRRNGEDQGRMRNYYPEQPDSRGYGFSTRKTKNVIKSHNECCKKELFFLQEPDGEPESTRTSERVLSTVRDSRQA